MIHLEKFAKLYEENSSLYEEAKSLSTYKDLLHKHVLNDISTDQMVKNGTFRFRSLKTDKMYSISQNGYIRYTDKGNQYNPNGREQVIISPITPKKNLSDIIYKRPVKNLDDYSLKFIFLSNYIGIKGIEKYGLDYKKHENLIEINVSKVLDSIIENDAEISKDPLIQEAIKKGEYLPNKYSKLIIKVGNFGLF